MFLLNSNEILAAVRSARGSRLDIARFDESCLQHTSYYFRLGSRVLRSRMPDGTRADAFYDRVDDLTEADPFLRLAPREYVRVESYEHFQLDKSILGIMGGVSDTARIGLQLVYSPFIDPLFPGENEYGRLELGLLNLSEFEAAIRLKSRLGKVSFFDVSDTYPVRLIAGSDSERKFQERKEPQ